MSPHSHPAAMYPLFLRVRGVRCVVVGGGPIAAQKARELGDAGALLRVVAPTLSDDWADDLERWGDRIEVRRRRFEEVDVRGARIVISATADPETDARVEAASRAEGALVNIVDVPDRCDFYAPAVVRRGPVTVAIGTGGLSPSLAGALRERIDRALPARLGDLAEALGELRPRLLATIPDYRERASRMNAVVRALLAALDHDRDIGALPGALRSALECTHPCPGDATCCVRVALDTHTAP